MVCLVESGNAFDPFAISVVRDGEIIGHVPRPLVHYFCDIVDVLLAK